MKFRMTSIAVLCVGGATLSAHAGNTSPPTLSNLNSLVTNDYGCKVLLCLADPQGPKTQTECRPPINRLERDLRRGRPFPTCNMGSASRSNYARYRVGSADPCPVGTRALAADLKAMSDGSNSTPPVTPHGQPTAYTALPPGNVVEANYGIFGLSLQQVCVGNARGSRYVWLNGDTESVPVYDRVFVGRGQSSRAVDVVIDNKLWHTVHF